MNYVFEELFKSFSMTAIHNVAVTHNWSEKYKKMTGPIAILIIILIAKWDYLFYAILSPIVILCVYYSFGNIKDFIASYDKPQDEDEKLMLIDEEDEPIVEEETTAITRPVQELVTDTIAFISGSTFTYLQFTFPNICFKLANDMEVDSCGRIELTATDNEIEITVSDGCSQYSFTLIDRQVSEYDKEILSLYFKKTDKTSFVFVINSTVEMRNATNTNYS